MPSNPEVADLLRTYPKTKTRSFISLHKIFTDNNLFIQIFPSEHDCLYISTVLHIWLQNIYEHFMYDMIYVMYLVYIVHYNYTLQYLYAINIFLRWHAKAKTKKKRRYKNNLPKHREIVSNSLLHKFHRQYPYRNM